MICELKDIAVVFVPRFIFWTWNLQTMPIYNNRKKGGKAGEGVEKLIRSK